MVDAHLRLAVVPDCPHHAMMTTALPSRSPFLLNGFPQDLSFHSLLVATIAAPVPLQTQHQRKCGGQPLIIPTLLMMDPWCSLRHHQQLSLGSGHQCFTCSSIHVLVSAISLPPPSGRQHHKYCRLCHFLLLPNPCHLLCPCPWLIEP